MSLRSAAEQLARSLPTSPYVGGHWQDSPAASTFDVIDPVTEHRLATVTEADEAAVDRAVVAARDALDDGAWGRMDGASRGQLLHRLAQLIEERVDDFADLESLDVGKPRIEPRV